MEMDEERPSISHGEDLDAKRNEEGKKLVEIETGDDENHGVNNGGGDGDGKVQTDCIVDVVPDHSLEEKRFDKVTSILRKKAMLCLKWRILLHI
ncbi:hypothetical protein LIER_24608 [Lithospermum erythrorhizon]|uniref:Uncharacterized protein n=1 Tax=Lithospermum erythrorhizon TaxID=34254 RepID=A0AAV3R511_LITER